MKKNIFFVLGILLLFICEIISHQYANNKSLWTNNFRIFSWIMMGIWYYEKQKYNFSSIQRIFLLSILLPIIVSLSSYIITEKIAIIVNICVNIGVLILWIFVFKKLGASVVLIDANQTLPKLIPAFFILPLFFYYFSLFQSLPIIYAIFVLIYILIFSYTGVLSAFLPINEDKRLWIVLGIMLLVVANIMNGFHTFLEKIPWAYPVIRSITVISKCMMIFGMINYFDNKPLVLAEEEE